MPWAYIVMVMLIQGLGGYLQPVWAQQHVLDEDEPRQPLRQQYPHHEHHENHGTGRASQRMENTMMAEPTAADEEITSMAQLAVPLMLSLPFAYSFEEAFRGEPAWYWDLVDAGGDLCRRGAKWEDIAARFGEATLRRRESDLESYLTTEPIRNRLLRAWEIVCAHYQAIEVPLPAGFDVSPFAHTAEETIHHHWVTGGREGRDEEPPPPSTSDHARSRSPPRDGSQSSATTYSECGTARGRW